MKIEVVGSEAAEATKPHLQLRLELSAGGSYASVQAKGSDEDDDGWDDIITIEDTGTTYRDSLFNSTITKLKALGVQIDHDRIKSQEN